MVSKIVTGIFIPVFTKLEFQGVVLLVSHITYLHVCMLLVAILEIREMV